MNKKRMINILASNFLLLIGLLTLLGCQPTSTTEVEPVAVTSEPTAVSVEKKPLAEVPTATATVKAEDMATPVVKTSPTDPPPTTESSAETGLEPAAPDSSEPIIIYERTGGYAGLTDHWEIYADGRITNNNGRAWQTDPADVAKLQADIIALDFFALESNYVPKNACCDLFTYSITVSDGTKTHTTTTVDQEASTPDSLWQTLDLVQAFITDSTAE